ncbi:hypothetical protein SAMD00019534_077640 [Acytostelium subglobosum LB1]|uniref:hypothetical protein n=1 Tax=Acytostelium subglobosum LB1 TaxID=1410327 RepID=UPI0006450F05|nr:hypothetical protein SAMD00019534_077640 [Acytostelium subglobosum LB1]GAM24589.1 hypothetical protein SAMD00019534_077640 [Acytostelium subglobosum LB1]|eukprot:XP_012752258.1 hypothetical protein SAMD00019534_077640 [Acytostelium subglobosum LB1]
MASSERVDVVIDRSLAFVHSVIIRRQLLFRNIDRLHLGEMPIDDEQQQPAPIANDCVLDTFYQAIRSNGIKVRHLSIQGVRWRCSLIGPDTFKHVTKLSLCGRQEFLELVAHMPSLHSIKLHTMSDISICEWTHSGHACLEHPNDPLLELVSRHSNITSLTATVGIYPPVEDPDDIHHYPPFYTADHIANAILDKANVTKLTLNSPITEVSLFNSLLATQRFIHLDIPMLDTNETGSNSCQTVALIEHLCLPSCPLVSLSMRVAKPPLDPIDLLPPEHPVDLQLMYSELDRLPRLLPPDSALRALTLDNLLDAYSTDLFVLMRRNRTITHLTFANLSIDTEKLECLSNVLLATNETGLRRLTLIANRLDTEQPVFMQALRINTTLTRLDIVNDNIDIDEDIQSKLDIMLPVE